MKKYVIILNPSVKSPEIITRIKTLQCFVLYDNTYIVHTDKMTAKEVYDYVLGDPTKNELMVIMEIGEGNNWGYADKNFWNWLDSIKEQDTK